MKPRPSPQPPHPPVLKCGPMSATGTLAQLVVALLGALLGTSLLLAVALDRPWIFGLGTAVILAVVLNRSWFRA